MANQILAQYFRLPIDVSKPSTAVPDVLSAAVPAVATGAALEFDFIFTDGALNDANLCDLSVYSAIYFKIESPANPHAGNAYVAAAIAAASFNLAATTAQWLAGTAEHIQVCIPAANNTLQPGSGSQQAFWLCVYGALTAGAAAAAVPPRQTGDLVPLCYYQIQVVDSGIPVGNPGQAVAPTSTKLSFVCSDGNTRDVTLIQTPNGAWTLQIGNPYNGPGQAKYSLLCADALYRDLTVILVQGAWTVDINQAGHN